MEKKFYKSATSKNPVSGAVEASNILFISGQLGIDPATGKMAEGDAAQTRQVMENLKTQVETAGYAMSDIVKVCIYVAADTNTSVVNPIYASYFQENYPARLLIRAAFPNPAVRIEIEGIAVR